MNDDVVYSLHEIQQNGFAVVKAVVRDVLLDTLTDAVESVRSLDLCSKRNGAIKFIPGSHKAGELGNEQVAEWRNKQLAVVCPAERGDVICMRPLILHSSSRSIEPVHRRVLHLEYAARQLPNGLEWSEPFDW
jgi:hypothetical protein